MVLILSTALGRAEVYVLRGNKGVQEDTSEQEDKCQLTAACSQVLYRKHPVQLCLYRF